jgi:phosphoribosylformylglycinamidine synthase
MAKYLNTYFRKGALSREKAGQLLMIMQQLVPGITGLETERVFWTESDGKLTRSQRDSLRWFLRDKHHVKDFRHYSHFGKDANVLTIGPLGHYESPDSTNARSACHYAGLPVTRLEEGRRYRIIADHQLTDEEKNRLYPLIHNRSNECPYFEKLKSFDSGKLPGEMKVIPLHEGGREALSAFEKENNITFEEFDANYILYLYQEVWGRDATDVELFDLYNCNSNHSRHHDFNGKLIIDGQEIPFTLFDIIKSTSKNRDNAVISFHDNASAIRGHKVRDLMPETPGMPSRLRMQELFYHFVLTVETHNHPSYIEAYQGAATGGGGRRRDNQMVGRGGLVAAAGAGFAGGNLHIPGYDLPWEDKTFHYDQRYESPLSFFVKATNGCFGDANEFGEPLVNAWVESFGLRIGDERWENLKPIMLAQGWGFIRDEHVKKNEPLPGWLICKIGGDAYRVGFGGGGASSKDHGENSLQIDWDSVQRANGEMAKKVDCWLRTCIAMGEDNPIENGTDSGAGGFLNYVKEMIFPVGGLMYLDKLPLGDQTLSPAEVLVSEYQENIGVLIKPENEAKARAIAEREKVPFAVVGTVTGDGHAVVIDRDGHTKILDFDLEAVIGNKYPQKTYVDNRRPLPLEPLAIPEDLTVQGAADLVFRLLGVASKEWLANKVDSSVTGKVVQGMKTGPLHLPVCNYHAIVPSLVDVAANAGSYSQRQTIGLVSAGASVRMTASEALLKLMFIPVSKRQEIKASANWMLAAKLPGGMAWIYDAALALRDMLALLGYDIDGGKDSMSMSSKIKLPDGSEETVRSLSTLVMTLYADCPDFRLKVTPDLKPVDSVLYYVDLAQGKTRMGGSALAQCLKQVGNECPDVENAKLVTSAFDAVQRMLPRELLLAGQIKSRGGLLATLGQMAFAGDCGFWASLEHPTASANEMLFNEELGFVLQIHPDKQAEVFEILADAGFDQEIHFLGRAGVTRQVKISFNGVTILDTLVKDLRALWQATSYELEKLQSTESCAASERWAQYDAAAPKYRLTFDPDRYPVNLDPDCVRPRVAVIRDEGTNSEVEVWWSLYFAGFEPVDVTISDIADRRIKLDQFVGYVDAGGFTYKDVIDPAKGSALVCRSNRWVRRELQKFHANPRKWSLGICNGCQKNTMLGLVPFPQLDENLQPAFVKNLSERFEARFSTMKIMRSPSILFAGMEGSILGLHQNHGGGRFSCPDTGTLAAILELDLAPLRFVDGNGEIAEAYPHNPNGSTFGINALCDPTGQHNVIMGHPERTVLKQQWLWWPGEWQYVNSPWLRMFQNALFWTQKQYEQYRIAA